MAFYKSGFTRADKITIVSPGLETSSLMQGFNHAVFFALVYILTTFHATFSAFCVAETFTAAKALKFQRWIIAQ